MKNRDIEKKLSEKCAALGIELDLDDIHMYSPSGKVFFATGCHTVINEINEFTTRTVALRNTMKDLNAGLVDCDNPNNNEGGCQMCKETA